VIVTLMVRADRGLGETAVIAGPGGNR